MERKRIKLRGCHLQEALKFSDRFTACINRVYELWSCVNDKTFLRGLVPLSGDVKNGSKKS